MKFLKIYLISQDKHDGYDTYDSAVVIAESPEQAKTIHPSRGLGKVEAERYNSWADDPSEVTAEYIGEADDSYTEPTVICASFNAG